MRSSTLHFIWPLSLLVACSASHPRANADATDAVGGEVANADVLAAAGLDAVAVPNLALEAFIEATHAAMCAGMQLCTEPFLFTDLQTCSAMASLGEQLTPKLHKFIAGVKAGKIIYSPTAAAPCITYQASHCPGNSPSLTVDHPCSKVFQGVGQLGAACDEPYECASQHCKRQNPASICPGVCAATLPSGAKCTAVDRCDVGFTCIAGQCASTDGAVGEVCHKYSCAVGLYCAATNAGPAKCATLVALGGGCYMAGQCAVGLYCNTPKPGKWGKCASQFAIGQPCSLPPAATVDTGFGEPDSPCIDHGICVPAGAADSKQGTCKAPGKLGHPCGSDAQCYGADLHCSLSEPGTGNCKLVPGLGEPCAAPGNFLRCMPPNVCNLKTGLCGPLPPIGEPCEPPFCAAGAACVKGTCQGSAASGEACNPVAGCLAGLECAADGTCALPKCGP